MRISDWSSDVCSSDLLDGSLGVADWLTILGEEWESCDNIGLYADDLTESEMFGLLMDFPEDLRPHMMDAAERALYDEFPEEVVIYRGCYALNKWGLSWTTDRAIAEIGRAQV